MCTLLFFLLLFWLFSLFFIIFFGRFFFVLEFGVPSSRSSSHDGPRGRKGLTRDQGEHTEATQGAINVDLMNIIYEEGYAGSVLFSLFDEWFKYSWNTQDIEGEGEGEGKSNGGVVV